MEERLKKYIEKKHPDEKLLVDNILLNKDELTKIYNLYIEKTYKEPTTLNEYIYILDYDIKDKKIMII